MPWIKTDKNADLEFCLPDHAIEFDKGGVTRAQGLSMVDFIIERDDDILLIEIKDPSNVKVPEAKRSEEYNKHKGDECLTKELVPKCRDTFTYLHLMEMDTKPLRYFVVIGIDAFSSQEQSALLSNYTQRLQVGIYNEADQPWKKQYITDSAVFSVEKWNQYFSSWQARRISATPASV